METTVLATHLRLLKADEPRGLVSVPIVLHRHYMSQRAMAFLQDGGHHLQYKNRDGAIQLEWDDPTILGVHASTSNHLTALFEAQEELARDHRLLGDVRRKGNHVYILAAPVELFSEVTVDKWYFVNTRV